MSSFVRWTTLAALALPACQSSPPGSTPAAASTAGGVGLTAPAPVGPDGPRVLVYHDMEGLAGQNDPTTYRFNHPESYPKGQEMLVTDLNAVIAGLFDGGAREVHVIDAHGSGNPEPDVLTAKLDPRAKQVFRETPIQSYVDVVAPNSYDAVVAVGMHAKTGSRGFASHTYTIGIELQINGVPITESELVGYSWGRVGVPMVLVTGDDRLQNDLKTMPWIEFVVTKQATAADSATLRPVAEVHAEMTQAAKRALEKRDQAKAMTFTGPLRVALRAVPPASLELMKGFPGVTYRDNTVEFEAKDFGEAYAGWVAIIGVARQSYSQVLSEMLRARPDGAQLMQAYSDRLFQRWMDVESNRWTPPAPTAPVAGKLYHGAN
ncbi:MAG: M55 family metallopeptidase [Gemmatimonadales bacterium]